MFEDDIKGRDLIVSFAISALNRPYFSRTDALRNQIVIFSLYMRIGPVFNPVFLERWP